MTEREQVVVIRGSFNATDALCVVASLTGDVDARVASDIIYPYHCFDAECTVPTLAGRKDVSLICLVDAVNGLGATADSFELKKESVARSKLMSAEIDDETAADTAHRTVTHHMGRSLRTIAEFDVRLKPRGFVHKRFWIVQTSEARLLVDSTTAGWFPLKLEAA